MVDISSPASRVGSVIPQSEVLELDFPRDLFEDSKLRGFGLSSVEAALSARPSAEGPSDKESLLWSIVRTGGEGLTRPLPRDKTENLYRQESGAFYPPVWPSTLPVGTRASEDNRLLKELQGQWGMMGLAVSGGIIKLEAVLKEPRDSVDPAFQEISEALAALHEDLNAQVAPRLAHALRLAAGYFNDLSVKRRRKLARAVKDTQLSKWLEETPESTSCLFTADVSGALEAARARRMDGLITIASRASSQTPPAASSLAASSRGKHFEP